jgi:hypothetical protein
VKKDSGYRRRLHAACRQLDLSLGFSWDTRLQVFRLGEPVAAGSGLVLRSRTPITEPGDEFSVLSQLKDLAREQGVALKEV